MFVAVAALLAVRITADEAADNNLTIGNAEIRSESDAVYFRLRAPKPAKTRYGIFRFMRDTGKWEQVGSVASFDKPVQLGNEPIEANDFFYPRNGYQEVELADLTYKIENLNNRVVVSIRGKSQQDEYFTSGEIKIAKGTPSFRFRYLTATQLWFDMRVEGVERPYSAGVGCFDLREKKILTITPKEMDPKHNVPMIVSEMSGDGENVWLGIAYCLEPTCLRNGIVMRIGQDGKIARRWYSGEKGLPTGAVIRVMPDGKTLWIVTTDGISLINDDTIKCFKISNRADIIEGGNFGFGPKNTPMPVAPEFATSSASIRDISSEYFLMRPKTPPALWALADENKNCFKDATDTIRLIPGKTLVVRPANDTSATKASFTPSPDEKIILKVAERQGGGIRVELPDMLWYSPKAVRMRIEIAGEFPSNNFLGNAPAPPKKDTGKP